MSDKILKLEQAQTLYQDLRGRIDALPTSSDIPEVPVQDIQINSTSILNNGVASIPIASTSGLGVIKKGMAFWINDDGTLGINVATSAKIKEGTTVAYFQTPSNQHEAIYYGLSKLAGVDLASETCTVGTYSTTAQTAIQTMLGAQAAIEVIRL